MPPTLKAYPRRRIRDCQAPEAHRKARGEVRRTVRNRLPHLLFDLFERESISSNGSRIPYPSRTGGGYSREGATRVKAELA